MITLADLKKESTFEIELPFDLIVTVKSCTALSYNLCEVKARNKMDLECSDIEDASKRVAYLNAFMVEELAVEHIIDWNDAYFDKELKTKQKVTEEAKRALVRHRVMSEAFRLDLLIDLSHLNSAKNDLTPSVPGTSSQEEGTATAADAMMMVCPAPEDK